MVIRIILIIAIAMITLSGVALAGDTAAVSVTASVVGTCKFGTGTGLGGGVIATLAFGALDISSTSDATATVNYQYWCASGVTAITTANNGNHFDGVSRRMSSPTTAHFIPYSFVLSNHNQVGAGRLVPRTATIEGVIANADYITKPEGNYSDRVVLTITP